MFDYVPCPCWKATGAKVQLYMYCAWDKWNVFDTIEVLFFYPSLSFSLFPSAYWKAGLFGLPPAETTEFQLTAERNGCHMLKKSGLHKPRTQSVLLDTFKKKKSKEKKRKLILLCPPEFFTFIPIKVYGLLDLFSMSSRWFSL